MKKEGPTMHKKFIDNGHGDCIYCCERRHDCCCGENTAKSLGYHYDYTTTTATVERPPMPKGLTEFAKLAFLLANPTSRETTVGIWRNGKQWFRNCNDLVDYHNNMETKT